MATRTYTTKSGDVYEWEETPQVLNAIQEYWKTVQNNKEKTES